MNLVITVLVVTAVLLLYTRWEIRLNQRLCPLCGMRISVDDPQQLCPDCGADFEGANGGQE